jgi:hypothetical protein
MTLKTRRDRAGCFIAALAFLLVMPVQSRDDLHVTDDKGDLQSSFNLRISVTNLKSGVIIIFFMIASRN